MRPKDTCHGGAKRQSLMKMTMFYQKILRIENDTFEEPSFFYEIAAIVDRAPQKASPSIAKHRRAQIGDFQCGKAGGRVGLGRAGSGRVDSTFCTQSQQRALRAKTTQNPRRRKRFKIHAKFKGKNAHFNCKKEIFGHVRQFQLSRSEIETEVELILCRAGMY